MRYSKFVTRLRSPPGKVIWSTGIGMVKFPRRGFCAFFRTGVPSGLVSVIEPTLGRNATGDTERISKPRRSFSPPMYERWNEGATNPPKPGKKNPEGLK